ncbi:MAG: ATPase [Bacteroidales bacterium]|nr:ATPase [Bacteroidales bacterium]
MYSTILTADSGSTSTNWALVSEKGLEKQINTGGINPYYMSVEEIRRIIVEELLPPLSPVEREFIREIHFYGSGCSTPSKIQLITEALSSISPNASIFAGHDVLASARAACGRGKGIACILGTGSNSCVYDGENIVKNAISLGYFLGDEGSGLHIGKLFLTRYLKNQVSPELKRATYTHFHLSFEEILNGLYQQDKPNRFIAPFSRFILDHAMEYPDLTGIVRQSFTEFVREYIRPFPEAETYPICFVGSVAYLMQDILREVFAQEGYSVTRIVRYPIEGLISYHQQQLQSTK